jgi:hypothetical protein
MPGTLIKVADLRESYSIDSTVKDGRLTLHVGAASRRLKGWVGAEKYEAAQGDSPSDAEAAEDLKAAEAALAMHYAILGLNTKITAGGVVKTVKETGSVSAPVVTSYLTPNETRQLAELYLEQAEEIARPYALADGTPGPELSIVE